MTPRGFFFKFLEYNFFKEFVLKKYKTFNFNVRKDRMEIR